MLMVIKKAGFFYKDKESNGGLLHAGPVWDFDWAWKNIGSGVFGKADGSGWGYKLNDYNPDINPSGWYRRLLQDSYFTNRLIERYFELRSSVLQLNNLHGHIDSVKTLVGIAQERHFAIWPIEEGYMAPEPGPPSQSYDEEITKLKNWITTRINWLDAHFNDLREEIVTEINSGTENLNKLPRVKLYPNPAKYHFNIESDIFINEIQIYNLIGQKVYQSRVSTKNSRKINISELPAGVYFVKLTRINNIPIIHKHIITK